jgi:tetratricopeptide (TPR) repeat protein
MYELDLICEINSYPLSYDPEGILLFCEKLLHKSDRNEQLLILHADIQFELMDMWSRACDEYLNSRLEHCVYPKYKFGRIISLYLKEYKNSIEVFQKAIEQKGDYFSAWYQIGLCQEDLGKYQEAVGAYEKVISLLRGKCGKHLLAPVELEYLYKSVLKSERIYRKCLGDYVMADCYDDLAEHVKLEAKQTVYLEQVWPAAKNNTECKDILTAAMEKRLSIFPR